MDSIPLCVFTSDKSDWTLGGFFYQLEKHGHWHPNNSIFQPIVFGYRRPDNLPDGVDFISLGNFSAYPKNNWSDAFLKALGAMDYIGFSHFWFMLDDYWIIRGVDNNAIRELYEYMRARPEIAKIDLAFDRLFSDPGYYAYYANNHATVGRLDLIRSRPESPYHMSLWGGLFSVVALKQIAQPGWTAQEVELIGTPLLRLTDYIVLGTRQAPCLHTNVISGDCNYFKFEPKLNPADIDDLRQNGFIPAEITI